MLRGHRVAHGRDDGRRDAQQTVPKAVDADDRLELGSLAAAREKGLVRSEGKEYVMQDGDVVLFRFNV